VDEVPAVSRIPLIAALTFLVGFAVADATGVRALGGVVLVLGGIWCAREARPLVGTRPTALLLGIALVLFALSHVLGLVIGAWPAVVVTAALVALAAAAIVRRGAVGLPA
jgi:hypothetical protein